MSGVGQLDVGVHLVVVVYLIVVESLYGAHLIGVYWVGVHWIGVGKWIVVIDIGDIFVIIKFFILGCMVFIHVRAVSIIRL